MYFWQVDLEAGEGRIEYDRQSLRVTYFPPASAVDVKPSSVQVMDKGKASIGILRH